jgi:carboxyl-terminal processing protease
MISLISKLSDLKFQSVIILPFLLIIQFLNADKLLTTPLMQQEAKWLVQALQQAHFNKVDISELNSTAFINNYLKKLDKQKLYFIQSDVDEFYKKYSSPLITYFQQGNLFPGFEIYNLYKTKALNRSSWVVSYLENEFLFDKNIIYNTDREDLSWEKDIPDLNNTWRKLVKFEILGEILSSYDSNLSYQEFKTDNFSTLLNESKQKVKKRYERWSKSIKDFEAIDVQELYLTSLTQMFDPHTTFMNIKEKEKFNQHMNNELVGIGAVLTDDDGYCTIRELLPGGPAESSRELKPNDQIIKVAQAEGDFVDVVDMKLSKIVDLIKGPKDTLVRLEIKPKLTPTATKIVRIIRDKVKLTSNLASASVHKVNFNKNDLNLGVIELRSFYGSTGTGPKATDDVEELINKLKAENIEGLILDLRRNGGGYLSEAVNLAGLFISRGPVVQVKSTDGKIRKKFDFNPKLSWDGPLIVLVSRYSASASEIVAGALQNHKRALVVGDKTTHGKGTVQSLIQMNLPFNYNASSGKKSGAKITIQKYYLPSGESTQIQGVKSDISMSSINHYLPIGESDLENSLECDRIPPVNFRRPVNEFVYRSDDLLKLKNLSSIRQSKMPEFRYLKKNVEWYKSKRAETSLSLNLENRILSKTEDKNFTQKMNNEFEKLSESSFTFKKVSLDVVDSQNLRSLTVRGDENSTRDTENNFITPESFDIRLHESLRVMTDWVEILENRNVSRKEGSAQRI